MGKEEIRALCCQYTDLTDEEITELLNMSSLLQPMADIEEADMFIDCPMIGGDALVIAEAKPTRRSRPRFRPPTRPQWRACSPSRRTNLRWQGRSGWESAPDR